MAQPPSTTSRKWHIYLHMHLVSHIEKILERVKQHSDFQPTKTIMFWTITNNSNAMYNQFWKLPSLHGCISVTRLKVTSFTYNFVVSECPVPTYFDWTMMKEKNKFATVVHTNKLIKTRFSAIKKLTKYSWFLKVANVL